MVSRCDSIGTSDEADPRAALPRRGKASVPARNKPSQPDCSGDYSKFGDKLTVSKYTTPFAIGRGSN
jgi:hypothetical protein